MHVQINRDRVLMLEDIREEIEQRVHTREAFPIGTSYIYVHAHVCIQVFAQICTHACIPRARAKTNAGANVQLSRHGLEVLAESDWNDQQINALTPTVHGHVLGHSYVGGHVRVASSDPDRGSAVYHVTELELEREGARSLMSRLKSVKSTRRLHPVETS